MADYSAFQEEPSQAEVKKLTNLCGEAARLEAEIATFEAKIEELAKRRRDVVENAIPQLMQAEGIKEITLENGLTVSLREEVRASFPSKSKNPEKREAAFRWLHDNGHAGLIKHKIELNFGKQERDKADKVVEHLRALGVQLDMSRDDSIHPQTLLAFLRERLREGQEIPLETFGAFVQKFAKISG